jgi:small subunit ribosomal protein S8
MSNTIDLIIRIKNGYIAERESIESPYTKMHEEVLKKLAGLKFIKGYKTEKDGAFKKFVIELRYEDGQPALTDVKIYSKPGRRWYVPSKNIKRVFGGMGASILSTPKGILTNSEAVKEKTGGELLFEVW